MSSCSGWISLKNIMNPSLSVTANLSKTLKMMASWSSTRRAPTLQRQQRKAAKAASWPANTHIHTPFQPAYYAQPCPHILFWKQKKSLKTLKSTSDYWFYVSWLITELLWGSAPFLLPQCPQVEACGENTPGDIHSGQKSFFKHLPRFHKVKINMIIF